MDITWIGHAAFLLRSGTSALLMDPFSETLGLRIPPPLAQASLVTVSNDQPHHSASDVAQAGSTVLSDPGEYELAGLRIKGLRTQINSSTSSETPAWNTIFIVEVEGLVICHLGGLGSPLSARQVENLSSPHVLLLPVGGHGVLSPAAAAELVNTLEPRIAVPMTYAHPGNNVELEPLSRFIEELGIKAPEAQGRLTVTKSNLPAETQVAVLQPAATLL
jgi:L-ascorbate metabolism protein UlaG (beta-lactamase superfamily)